MKSKKKVTKSKKKISKSIVPVILVTPAVIARIIIYLYAIIIGIGTFEVGDYISIAINFIMYISILKYAIDYFVKGKDVSLSSLVFRYGIATLTTLINFNSGNKNIYILTAVMLFLVPYVSASLQGSKKNKLVMVIAMLVLVISIALGILYIKYPVENSFTQLGKIIYNLDALNQAVEWTLFSILGFARGMLENKNESKVIKKIKKKAKK